MISYADRVQQIIACAGVLSLLRAGVWARIIGVRLGDFALGVLILTVVLLIFASALTRRPV